MMWKMIYYFKDSQVCAFKSYWFLSRILYSFRKWCLRWTGSAWWWTCLTCPSRRWGTPLQWREPQSSFPILLQQLCVRPQEMYLTMFSSNWWGFFSLLMLRAIAIYDLCSTYKNESGRFITCKSATNYYSSRKKYLTFTAAAASSL